RLEACLETRRLFAARLLDRSPPTRRRRLPVTDRAPLRHHIGSFVTHLPDVFREIHSVAVHLEADEIQVRGTLLDQVCEFLTETGKRGGRGMCGVDFVDHAGYSVDGIEYARVLELQVRFIADHPCEQRRVIAILQHLGAGEFELLRYGIFVIVVESKALPADVDAKQYREAVFRGGIEEALCVFGGPGADRIAAVRRERGDAFVTSAGTLDLVRLAISQQQVAPVPVHDLDGYGGANLRLFHLWRLLRRAGDAQQHQVRCQDFFQLHRKVRKQ